MLSVLQEDVQCMLHLSESDLTQKEVLSQVHNICYTCGRCYHFSCQGMKNMNSSDRADEGKIRITVPDPKQPLALFLQRIAPSEDECRGLALATKGQFKDIL